MLSFFLNPLLLIGLAGVVLPVVAHLLSRRRFDVVEWGAMQFLDVSRKTRRKMKLEELLLLLIRMSAIAMIAFAVARPWINTGFLTGYQSAGSRDLVIVIDGSNSMSRSDGMTSLHERAKRRAVEFLETLQPGDTAAVIDARDQPLRTIASPIQDLDAVTKAIMDLPAPGGASDLQNACEDAVGILGRCSNGNREIIVLTDRQRVGWNAGSDASWKRFDEVLNFPAVRPQVWVLDVSRNISDVRRNIAVGRIELAGELTVPDFPVRFEVTLTNTGTTDVEVPVSVLLDGQRLASMESRVAVSAKSTSTFSRSLPLTGIGTKVITVEATLPDDAIPADDRSTAAVQVRSAIPVLLVDSSSALQASGQDTFFAKMALTASENQSPWILAKTVKARDFTPDMLNGVAAVILANVDSLSNDVLTALQKEIASGKGLFVCLGSNTQPDVFRDLYQQTGFFPSVTLDRIRSASPDPNSVVTIAPYSLEAQWLERFRKREGASFLTAEFQKWWVIDRQNPAASETTSQQPDLPQTTANPTNQPGSDTPADGDAPSNSATGTSLLEIAQLNSGDALLLQGRYGRGATLLMTSTLDASWNTLPAELDYVPFLHEALFQMASNRITRNVNLGDPIRSVLPADSIEDAEPGFETPAKTFEPVDPVPDDEEVILQTQNTNLPGLYTLKQTADGKPLDSFVVNYDQSEHQAEVLTEDDRARLIVGDRLKFVDDFEALKQLMYQNESRSELWSLLLWLFLGLLVLEVWITRRMIQKGYAESATAAPAADL